MHQLNGDILKARKGQEEMRQRCMDCALKNTPPNVKFIMIRSSLSGRAWVTQGKMAAPRPVTRKALYIFLHECAHMTLPGHGTRSKKSHIKELEAEKWAHDRMKEAGIPVPKEMTDRAKGYVSWKIDQAIQSGAKNIDSKARKFAGYNQQEISEKMEKAAKTKEFFKNQKDRMRAKMREHQRNRLESSKVIFAS